jgi:3-oxoacyl-(acyl-carrier-protein) synthase
VGGGGLSARRGGAGGVQTWGNTFYKALPNVAPLRGALAVWGLGIDDIAVGSFHGTSTNANDRNESQVVHRQMEHLGRTRGNPLYVIAQKWLTGHPKGPAAAWMFNGMVQCILEGLVPGNRNIDNVAPELQQYHHLVYPNASLRIGEMQAGLLKSFGFGQVTIHADTAPRPLLSICFLALCLPPLCLSDQRRLPPPPPPPSLLFVVRAHRRARRSWWCIRTVCWR